MTSKCSPAELRAWPWSLRLMVSVRCGPPGFCKIQLHWWSCWFGCNKFPNSFSIPNFQGLLDPKMFGPCKMIVLKMSSFEEFVWVHSPLLNLSSASRNPESCPEIGHLLQISPERIRKWGWCNLDAKTLMIRFCNVDSEWLAWGICKGTVKGTTQHHELPKLTFLSCPQSNDYTGNEQAVLYKILKKLIFSPIISSKRKFFSSVLVLASEACLPETGIFWLCSQSRIRARKNNSWDTNWSWLKEKWERICHLCLYLHCCL